MRILIVEDEPGPARYLQSLFDLLGEGRVEVVGTAFEGGEGLELVKKTNPHVVFTDVRMPGMDGIAFLRELSAVAPSVIGVIVSGFEEFDYARQAVALGVREYLLKPVDPNRLKTLLGTLFEEVEARQQRERSTRLLGSLRGDLGGDARYVVALVRHGGPLALGLPALQPELRERGQVWSVSGRDQQERLWLADADTNRPSFEAEARGDFAAGTTTTKTLVGLDRSVASADLPAAVRELGDSVDRLLRIGHSGAIWGRVAEGDPVAIDPIRQHELQLALRERAAGRLEQLVTGQLDEWQNTEVSARQLTRALRQFLLLAQAESPGRAFDWERELEQGLAAADTEAEVAALAVRLAAEVAGLSAGTGPDAPETFQQVRRYLDAQFAQPISLDELCQRFGVSQSYLSKQFRRYECCTFHEFLTARRLDAAERLMRENASLPLKLVASAVGYQDPFHFSRAYKASRGRPPSEFRSAN